MKKLLITTFFLFVVFGAHNALAVSPTVLSSATSSVELTSATSWTISNYTVPSTGQNRCLTVMLNLNDRNAVTATWNGASMTKIVNVAGAQRAHGIMFNLVNPDTGNHNLVFSWSTSRTDYSAIWMTLQDCDQTTPMDTSVDNPAHSSTAGDTALTANITTVSDNDLGIVWMFASGATSINENAGQTNLGNFTPVDTGDANVLSTKPLGAAGNYTMGYTWTNSAPVDMYMVAIRYQAPSAAATTPRVSNLIFFE